MLFMELFRKGKTHIIAKFHRTDFVICCHSGEGKIPSYSRVNTVSASVLLRVRILFISHATHLYVDTSIMQKILLIFGLNRLCHTEYMCDE